MKNTDATRMGSFGPTEYSLIKGPLSLRAKCTIAAVLTVAAVQLLFLLLAAYDLTKDMERILESRVGTSAAIQARALAMPLWNLDVETVKMIVTALEEDPDVTGAFVSTSEGATVVARGRIESHDQVIDQPIVIPKEHGSDRIGTLRLAYSEGSLRAMFYHQIFRRGLEILIFVAVIAIAIHFVISGLIRPIKEMSLAMQRWASGERNLELPVFDTSDEIGTISRVFQGTKRDLEALHEGLERKVEERTLALTKAKEEADAANAAKSQFLANISHEIRTPMNSILGFSELLLASNVGTKERQYLETIHVSARGLLRIMDDVLDISRIQAGKIEIKPQAFSPRSLLTAVERMFMVQAKERRIRMSIEILPEIPGFVIGDELRVQQVLLNIVGNAIRFTPEGGSVRIRATLASSHERKVSILVSVTDTGIGIPLEARDTIFEPFTQVDSSTSRGYGGAGLGLAISSRLVKLMGGAITLESQVGEGSTFFVEIPFEIVSGIGLVDQQRREVSVRPLRVLVAEDSPSNRALIKAMLEEQGHSVLTAENGLEALKTIAEDQVDLVLMDCHMPVLDGYEATRKLRAEEKATGRRIPVMALTADAQEETRVRCLAAGMDDYAAKPIDCKTLASKIALLSGSEEAAA